MYVYTMYMAIEALIARSRVRTLRNLRATTRGGVHVWLCGCDKRQTAAGTPGGGLK
jgi:hypothetical protein